MLCHSPWRYNLSFPHCPCQLLVPGAEIGPSLDTANGNSHRRTLMAPDGFHQMSSMGKCVDSTQTRYTRVRATAWGATTVDQCANKCSTTLGSADVAGFGFDIEKDDFCLKRSLSSPRKSNMHNHRRITSKRHF